MHLTTVFILPLLHDLVHGVSISERGATDRRFTGVGDLVSSLQSQPGITLFTSPSIREALTSNENAIERRRRDKLESLRREVDELQQRISTKDPSMLNTDEKLQLSVLRAKLTYEIGKLSGKMTPHSSQIREALLELRHNLRKQSQLKDQGTKDLERKASNAERFQRFKTRQKAKRLGINITVKLGRKPKVDDAPPILKSMRSRKVRYLKKKRLMKIKGRGEAGSSQDRSSEEDRPIGNVLQEGWRFRKRRSALERLVH